MLFPAGLSNAQTQLILSNPGINLNIAMDLLLQQSSPGLIACIYALVWARICEFSIVLNSQISRQQIHKQV